MDMIDTGSYLRYYYLLPAAMYSMICSWYSVSIYTEMQHRAEIGPTGSKKW